MRLRVQRSLTVLALILTVPAIAQDEFPEADAILRALDAEMERSMTLQLEDLEKPYMIQYTVADTVTHQISAAYGALISSDENHGRTFRSQIRVGSYELDNTNFQGGGGGAGFGRRGGGRGPGRGGGGFGGGTRLPVDDEITALRKAIWLASDRDYKSAVETLSQKRSYMKDRGIEERPADNTEIEPVQHFEPRVAFSFDEKAWQERMRTLSAKFLDYPNIVDSSVRLQAVDGRSYLVSSEGSRIVTGDTYVILTLNASAQAEDGEIVRDDRAILAEFPAQLPDDAGILEEVASLADGLARAVAAPRLEDYVGPILFDGSSSPQLFQQLLARGAGAQPQPVGAGRRRRGGSQNLERFMNRKILPTAFQVYDDPRVAEVGDDPLAGHYRFDNEGVEPDRVDLVVNGRVQDLLMSRTPIAGRSGSNGHARGAGNRAGVGCLFVESKKGLSDAELKSALLEAAEAQGLDFAIRVSSLEGGGARGVQAALARLARGGGRGGGGGAASSLGDPIFVHKVYVEDGREEPVRGCEFDAIDIRDLGLIAAAGSSPTVLNRFGGNPTSVVAPAILFEELELISIEEEQQPKPILDAPHARKD